MATSSKKKTTGVLGRTGPLPPERTLFIFEWDDEKKEYVKNEKETSSSLAELLMVRCRELDKEGTRWIIRDHTGNEIMTCAALERLRLHDEP